MIGRSYKSDKFDWSCSLRDCLIARYGIVTPITVLQRANLLGIVSPHLGIPRGHIFQIHILNRLRQTKCFLTKLKSNFLEDHIGDGCVTLR